MGNIFEKQRKNLQNKIIDHIKKSDVDQIIKIADFLGIHVQQSLSDWNMNMNANNREIR